MKMLQNNVYHAKTKHIYAHFNYIREQLEEEAIQWKYVSSNQQIADIFTKPLKKKKSLHQVRGGPK